MNTDVPTTVVIKDWCDAGDSTVGTWKNGPDPDEIWINRCRLSDDTEEEKRQLLVHEMGHALRLEHPPQTEYYRTRSIMYSPSMDTPHARPMEHDLEDYYDIWIN